MITTARIGLIAVFVALGLFFTFVSATGVIRLPDVFPVLTPPPKPTRSARALRSRRSR